MASFNKSRGGLRLLKYPKVVAVPGRPIHFLSAEVSADLAGRMAGYSPHHWWFIHTVSHDTDRSLEKVLIPETRTEIL